MCAVGRYVLDAGNSPVIYLPIKNYQAMLETGRRWNEAHFG